MTVSIAPPGGSGVTVSPAVLTFTTGNWSTAQTVTVTAAHDDDLANDTAMLAHTAAGGGYNDATATVTVTVTDDDTAAITVSPTTLSVNEGDPLAALHREAHSPTGRGVTVSIAPPGGSGVTVSPAVLTFTTDNWSTAQTVTVTAAHDDDLANDTAMLAHTAAGGGYNDATATVTVTVTDDDTAAITASPTTLSVNEGDAAGGTYTVKLAAQPARL